MQVAGRGSHRSPQRALDAHHAQLLGAVEEFALEFHVLQHGGDVGPVVLGHSPTNSQVVAIPWKTAPGSLSGLRVLGWAGSALQSLKCSPGPPQLAQPHVGAAKKRWS